MFLHNLVFLICDSAGSLGRFVRPSRRPELQLLATPGRISRDCSGLSLHGHGPAVLPEIETSGGHESEAAPGLPGRGAAVHRA